MSKFKRWYNKNKEEYNAERKEKYDTDLEYKEKQLENNKNYREEHKTTNEFVFEINGQQFSLMLYTSCEMAERANVSITALRKWEKANIIPETPLKDSKGFRYYTEDFIDLTLQILDSKNLLKAEKIPKELLGVNYLCKDLDKNMLVQRVFYTIDGLCDQLNITKEEHDEVYKKKHFPKPKTVNEKGEILYTKRIIGHFGRNMKKIPNLKDTEEKFVLHRYMGLVWRAEGILEVVKPYDPDL